VNANDNLDDYWTGQPNAPEKPSAPHLKVATIDGVEPLDEQFGVDVPKTIPDALYEPLFGQPDGSSTPLQTYAILDAAKVPNLPELLEASELEHRCLFKGAAYDEMKDVAPWIVQLEEDNNFTRNLFTSSKAPWHLWNLEPGICVRSRGTLDEMWAHFRKFTRVQDENGAWFYLRAYDPRILAQYIRRVPAFAQRFLTNNAGHGSHEVMFLITDTLHVVRNQIDSAQNTVAGPFQIGEADKQVFREITFARRADEILKTLKKIISTPSTAENDAAYRKAILSSMLRIYHYGFTQPLQQERFAIWEIYYGAEFERADQDLLTICAATDKSSGDRFTLFSKRMSELYP